MSLLYSKFHCSAQSHSSIKYLLSTTHVLALSTGDISNNESNRKKKKKKGLDFYYERDGKPPENFEQSDMTDLHFKRIVWCWVVKD